MQVGGAGVHDAPHTLPDALPHTLAHTAEMQRVCVLVQEAREDIEQWNGGARQKRERVEAGIRRVRAGMRYRSLLQRSQASFDVF